MWSQDQEQKAKFHYIFSLRQDNQGTGSSLPAWGEDQMGSCREMIQVLLGALGPAAAGGQLLGCLHFSYWQCLLAFLLLPLSFSSTIFIFSVPSYPARLSPLHSFSGGQGRSFLCQEQPEATRGKRCQLCWWGWMAPSPMQMPGVFHLTEDVSQACSLLKAPSLRSRTPGTRTGAVSPALELKFPNLWSSRGWKEGNLSLLL